MEIDIEICLDWMRDNAPKIANAKASMVFQTEKRKSIKADLMQRSLEKTESAKESWAYSHPEYKKHLEDMRIAIYDYEIIRVQMMACELKIEAWRSIQATNRMIDKAHL
jgi:hypothetical protein